MFPAFRSRVRRERAAHVSRAGLRALAMPLDLRIGPGGKCRLAFRSRPRSHRLASSLRTVAAAFPTLSTAFCNAFKHRVRASSMMRPETGPGSLLFSSRGLTRTGTREGWAIRRTLKNSTALHSQFGFRWEWDAKIACLLFDLLQRTFQNYGRAQRGSA
jgi:hypothetical protein